jgi:large subunit ribosomal protein L10
MALTKDKKHEIVKEVSDLLVSSKMTVVTAYQGTPVKAMQQLRRAGRENGTTFKVVKNRLVRKAIESTDSMKDLDTKELTGMLLYAFNTEDEVAPAQVLAEFAKKQPSLEFVGAISEAGMFLSADEVKALAELPGKEQLVAQIIATLNSPVDGIMSGLSGNLHALLDGVEAKATN